MYKKISLLFLLMLSGLLAGCGMQIHNTQTIPANLQTVNFNANYNSDNFSQELSKALNLYRIKIVRNDKSYPTLIVNSVRTDDKVVSVFMSSKAAETLLTLDVTASINVPNKGIYPIEVHVVRTFFDNSMAALAKSEEKDQLHLDMHQQAARQLVIQLISLMSGL